MNRASKSFSDQSIPVVAAEVLEPVTLKEVTVTLKEQPSNIEDRSRVVGRVCRHTPPALLLSNAHFVQHSVTHGLNVMGFAHARTLSGMSR